jgi:hypothetical protein
VHPTVVLVNKRLCIKTTRREGLSRRFESSSFA